MLTGLACTVVDLPLVVNISKEGVAGLRAGLISPSPHVESGRVGFINGSAVSSLRAASPVDGTAPDRRRGSTRICNGRGLQHLTLFFLPFMFRLKATTSLRNSLTPLFSRHQAKHFQLVPGLDALESKHSGLLSVVQKRVAERAQIIAQVIFSFVLVKKACLPLESGQR